MTVVLTSSSSGTSTITGLEIQTPWAWRGGDWQNGGQFLTYSWHTTATRAVNTAYQHTDLDTPLFWSLQFNGSTSYVCQISKNGTTWSTVNDGDSDGPNSIGLFIPYGYYYKVLNGYSGGYWHEVRHYYA